MYDLKFPFECFDESLAATRMWASKPVQRSTGQFPAQHLSLGGFVALPPLPRPLPPSHQLSFPSAVGFSASAALPSSVRLLICFGLRVRFPGWLELRVRRTERSPEKDSAARLPKRTADSESLGVSAHLQSPGLNQNLRGGGVGCGGGGEAQEAAI